jgi:hypothetical protein
MFKASSAFRTIILTSALSAIPVGVVVASTESARAFSITDVRPVYRPANIPDEQEGFFDNSILGQQSNASNPASFGYFFDTNKNNSIVNALGFAVPLDWSSLTSSDAKEYDVILWKYTNGGANPLDYEEKARVTFDRDSIGSYVDSAAYYWLPLAASIDLGLRTDLDDSGFVVSAVGFYNQDSVPFLFGGTGDFDPSYGYIGNGLNVRASNFYDNSMPIPIDYDPSVAFGYFNANVSYFEEVPPVPGPLPLFGAAAAFGWTRRLRRRINAFG